MSQSAAAAPQISDDPAAAFDRLLALVSGDLERVNTLIAERMQSDHAPLIPQLADHLIAAGGKRVRPVLTLAAAGLCGYEGDDHIRLAATVEFIHTATLLHDDVVDESARRRGRATANTLFGNKPAILVGDYLFSRSFQLMVETGRLRVLSILSDASAVIAEGEVLQLSAERDLSGGEPRYLKVIEGKTAALFAAAAEVGAVVADAGDLSEIALRTYGMEIGLAFQLVDDLLDYGGASAAIGKNVGDDFREGKATLPVLLAHARGSAEERAFWSRVIEAREQNEGDLDEALAIMTRLGTLAETRDRAFSHARAAKAALEIFPEGPMRAALADLADFVVMRAA